MSTPAAQPQVMLGPLAALAARYERMAARGEAPVPGFAPTQIAFVLVLGRDGRLVAIQDERTWDGKKKRPKVVEAPQMPKRASSISPGLLWDKTAYVLGATRLDALADDARKTRNASRTASEHEAFKARHTKLLTNVDDDGAVALLSFLAGWTPDDYAGLAYADDMLDQNVAFRLDGDMGFLHASAALRQMVVDQLTSPDAKMGQCLISGKVAPIARLHPAIKGVPGAQTAGASLVSFND
ncbi:MAG TPA: type I-C CRISPR-associated protein Cas8c/Csd1, partial [Caulobacteraceae bacterium]|nr:type I-C CRISPR-associated protein Cas8c/Csd1 [Caulobacteraceae bacterium]